MALATISMRMKSARRYAGMGSSSDGTNVMMATTTQVMVAMQLVTQRRGSHALEGHLLHLTAVLRSVETDSTSVTGPVMMAMRQTMTDVMTTVPLRLGGHAQVVARLLQMSVHQSAETS